MTEPERPLPPVPPPPAPHRSSIGRALSHLTLRTRMVVLTVTLLVVGLAVSTVAATTLLRDYLVGQVDRQLVATASALGGVQIDWIPRYYGSGSGLPSDYYFSTQPADGRTGLTLVQAETERRWGAPDLPTLTQADVAARAGAPFTVDGTVRTPGIAADETTQWRVLAVATTDSAGGYNGALLIALPLGDIVTTTSQLSKILALTCLSIALVGGALGYLAVRRSLRPLRTIEATARAIAGGDMSQRIPPIPPSTEVGSLAASLNVMLGRIEHAFDVQSASESRMRQFVADASHELRTPLVSIRGYAELYRMGAITTPEQSSEAMARIEGSAIQMGTLVEDLLALARLDEGRALRRDPVDLLALAHDARQDLAAMDPERDVRLLPPPDGDSCVVVGDEARLRQVLTNLIGNVVQHTPAGSPVEIAVEPAGTDVVVEVRDHGPGIPAEHRERVFERFHRVDASRTSSSGGSGLGMAIVQGIVSAHGGHVVVLPTPGGGATVQVRIPRGSDYDGDSA